MSNKIVRLDVLRAQQERPADVVFTVEFWRLPGERWWRDPYALMGRIGALTPKQIRTVAHALADDVNHLWDTSGSPRPPKRKAVKRRKGRR